MRDRFVPKDEEQKLHFSVPVAGGMQRFRELIIYISKKSESDPYFGAIKLNKILYYSDFRAFERFGVPLTGVKYFRLPKGPAPKSMMPVQAALVREGAIRVDLVKIAGYDQHRTIALREPVLEHFKTDELLLVDEIIAELRQQTATEVSDASHDVRWRTLHHKDDMPYEFAFLSDEQITDEEIEITNELASRFGWKY
jgi:hypothetical protein